MATVVESMRNAIIEVVQAIIPLVVFFLIFQAAYLRYPLNYFLRLLLGMALAAVGLVLFIAGVFIGFLPAGEDIGRFFGSFEEKWMLIALGVLLGFLATYAEPAVRVLCYQVEKASTGYVNSRLMLYTLSIGVAVLVGIGMARISYGIPLAYIIIPGYLLAVLLLFVSDRDFIGVSFDAGGVTTGPMAVTFLMSVAVGAAAMIEGGDPLIDGFGLIALIALAPIIFVMSLGVIIRLKKGGE
ncbi:DUF1538 domain-containing protein [Candidatus Methanocrinis natronophilus]|uniref:DUF1538 domain-containing protein n=1 Tax=Candidatus Methanocrinis natronophilus TaxID=3033396 RepID=A0ABT5X707_9EURY|nr:DUF1538 domain-containing protein [Candidatus Methanocrinis natronophilus]MDF0590466.1 DUF1538 domain-containing protein [Candidatus Methanocrinis natronophilus]